MRERTITSHSVHAALRGATCQGLDGPTLLRRIGTQPALLGEPWVRITPGQFTRLMQLLWKVLDDEYIDFDEVRSKHGTSTVTCHTLIRCQTLERAPQHDELSHGLFPQAPLIHLWRNGDLVRLSPEEHRLPDPDHFFAKSLLVIWRHLTSWLIDQRVRLEEAISSYPAPNHWVEYDLLFPCPRRFSTSHTNLLFTARYLGISLLQDERTLKRSLQHSPANLLAHPDGDGSLTSQARHLLDRDCRRWPNLDQVACQLHMSSRTPRHHPYEESGSFQQLKGHLCRDLAIHHLDRDELSTQDIAEQLGFSEPPAFHCAFKRWTGLIPGAYRHQTEA